MPKTATALVLALGLLLPAAMLGGAWWLTQSGVIERLAADEAEQATAGLDAFAARVIGRLRALAATPVAGRVLLVLDRDGRPRAPFTPWPNRDDAADPHAELELAVSRILAESGSLDAARERLAQARARTPPLVTAPLSFDLLARLLEAQLAAEAGDVEAARRLRVAVLAGEVPMPAAAARPVVAFLDALVPGADRDQAQAWLGAAALATLLEEHHVEVPAQLTRAPNGALIVPVDAGLAVLGQTQCAAQLRRELRQATAPDAALALTAEPSARTIATTTLLPLPFVVHAAFRDAQPSEQLAWLAHTLLGLAGVAFVLGNLLALRIARKERALARSKSAFVDLVSHELRTPLQALALKTEMLAHGLVPSARVGEYCRDAHVEVGRLVALVQRILDFSRLSGPASAATLAPTDLRAVLARCVRETRATLAATHQRLVVEAPRTLGSLVADAELLACAIRNLLHNASKFSPPRTAIVLRAERAGDVIRVQVEDRGAGVAAHERDAVFAAFRRGEGARGGRVAGSGLGLVDRGRRHAPASGHRHRHRPRRRWRRVHVVAAGARGTGLMRLLVVEDDAAIRASLVDFFTAKGDLVTAVASAEAADASLRTERFAAVLLDLLLPGDDGLDLLRQLRRRGDKTPVLIATARGEEDQRIRGLRLGADDYLVKPFSLRELEARIAAVLRRAGSTAGRVRLGAVEIDLDGHAIVRAGKRTHLVAKEAELLAFFLLHRGRTLSRDELLRSVWGHDAVPSTRTVDTHVFNLRQKLEPDPDQPQHLLTVHGVGYQLAAEPEQ